MIQAEHLYFAYGKKDYILKDFNFQVAAGQVVSVIGPNGAGKSTLVKCLCRVFSPDRGKILINNKEIQEYQARSLARQISYVPQEQNISFDSTVYDFILLGRRPYIKWRVREHDLLKVSEIIDKLGINQLSMRSIKELSGGEKQKVNLARALAQEPEIIILDEPTANLDINHQLEAMQLLRKLADQEGLTVVAVLHDLNLAYRFSDKVFLLQQGEILASGSPAQVLNEENIQQAYKISVELVETSSGIQVVPL